MEDTPATMEMTMTVMVAMIVKSKMVGIAMVVLRLNLIHAMKSVEMVEITGKTAMTEIHTTMMVAALHVLLNMVTTASMVVLTWLIYALKLAVMDITLQTFSLVMMETSITMMDVINTVM
jgi:hypothetical protein